ncbi:MAG: MFS transporter [Alphaproteobacteria bacterium]|nr:MFS transporter [Alphaproteobacteria bacterium]
MTDLAVRTFAFWREQGPIYMVSLGHASIHWIAATFYVLLPYISQELGFNYSETGLLVSIFYISSTIANLPGGTVVDLMGRRVIIQMASLGICAVALLVAGLSRSFLLLAAMVSLIGATNMLWHPAAISYLSTTYAKTRGYALSIHALGANLGDAVAPLAAGALLLVVGWHEVALVNALPCLVVAAAIYLMLHRSDTQAKRPAGGLDFRGYVYSLVQVVKTRAVWSLCLMAGFRTMMQNGLLVFLPLYLAHELKVNPFWMGFTLMALQVGGAIAAPIAGTLSDRIGRRPIVLAGLWSTTVIVIGLTFIESHIVYIAGISFLGFCLYAVRPVIHSWLMDVTPGHLGASVTSIMFGVQSAFSTVMPLAGGAIADRYGLTAVFYALGATIFVANFLALLVPKSEAAPAGAHRG